MSDKQYKVGDRVICKTREEIEDEYPYLYYIENIGYVDEGIMHMHYTNIMLEEHAGAVATIKAIITMDTPDRDIYKFHEFGYQWNKAMFKRAIEVSPKTSNMLYLSL